MGPQPPLRRLQEQLLRRKVLDPRLEELLSHLGQQEARRLQDRHLLGRRPSHRRDRWLKPLRPWPLASANLLLDWSRSSK